MKTKKTFTTIALGAGSAKISFRLEMNGEGEPVAVVFKDAEGYRTALRISDLDRIHEAVERQAREHRRYTAVCPDHGRYPTPNYREHCPGCEAEASAEDQAVFTDEAIQ